MKNLMFCVMVLIFSLSVSRVGFSVFSNQVNIVCVSTELKTRLATLAYDFCTGESFAAETNLRASGYDIFFSDLTFFLSLFLSENNDNFSMKLCEFVHNWSTSDGYYNRSPRGLHLNI